MSAADLGSGTPSAEQPPPDMVGSGCASEKSDQAAKIAAPCEVNSGDGAQIGPIAVEAAEPEVEPQISDEAVPEAEEIGAESNSKSDSSSVDSSESPPKPQPNLNKAGELKMPDFFDQLESQWVGAFNQRMAVPYKDYASSSALGEISWDDFALVENEENIRKGHHAICPLVGCRKSGRKYRCKIVSCSRIHFNLSTLGFREKEFEDEIKAYLMERQFLFAFDHPFIRSGLGFFTDSNYNFGIFLEDFPHGTLLDYYEKLESGKIVCRFKEEEVRMIAAQMVLALEYLHCVGCVHRDVQASNVLVDARGYIKLTDFAITTTTKAGERLFSVTCFRYYAAPEYFNDKGYSYPVDFYALGLMLYELLTQECFTDQEDIFDCDGSVDWGILPDELAALLRERQLAELKASGGADAAATAEQRGAVTLPTDHVVPSEAARGFVDDCLIYEPEFRPDRNSARFYDWFDGVDFEQLYCKCLELPWRPDKIVSYQAKPDEEYPLDLILDRKPVPPTLQPYTHLF